jgi:nucleoid DNA-binding protein
VRLNLIIKEVAENLQIPYKDVNTVVKFAFLSVSKRMKEKDKKITLRYIGTFIRKLSKRETYKNYKNHISKKNENN